MTVSLPPYDSPTRIATSPSVGVGPLLASAVRVAADLKMPVGMVR